MVYQSNSIFFFLFIKPFRFYAEDNLQLPVSYNDYYDKLVEYSMIKIQAIANVKETTQTWIDQDIFQVIKPSLKIEVGKCISYYHGLICNFT